MGSSLYIHIPFCRRKCLYCNFYSDIYEDGLAVSFLDALSAEARGFKARDLHTIYIGGGTPTVLDKGLFRKLVKDLGALPMAEGCEFTVEANPESLDEDKVSAMLDAGVNRLSIGVQSLDDRKLKRIGRLHDAARAGQSVHLAAKKGVKNIGIDLIFGVWGEDPDAWARELEEAVRLPITHVSCYELTYEKGTPLFLSAANKSVARLEDDCLAAMYENAIDILGARGFKQYEVSNFAKVGYRSRHNLNYWENDPYIGLGPSAFSYIDGTRRKNAADIKEYIGRSGSGRSLTEFSEKLSPIRRAKETAAVKIRTKEGIDFERFKAKTGFDFTVIEKRVLPGLIEEGLIKYKKGDDGSIRGICLKRKGFLFCDTVSSMLL